MISNHEVAVTKNPDGYVTVEIIFSEKTFYMEIGKTKYSGYIDGEADKPIFLEGDIDVAE